MWKVFSYLGFDNFFLPLSPPPFKHGSPALSCSFPDSREIKINRELMKLKSYSDDDLANKSKEPSSHKSTLSSFHSESNPQENNSNERERAEEFLKELVEKTQSGFEGFELIYEEKDVNKQGLKIYLKSYVNQEKHRINIYRSECRIPCSPELFLEFLNDTPLQISLDPNIEEFQSFENPAENLFLMYLLYKKMLVVDSRDFVYLKYYKTLDQKNGSLGYVTKSLEHEKYPELKGKVRGEILLSGNVITKINEKQSMIVFYSEIDLKMNLPIVLVKPKTISEMKKYIESFLKYLKSKGHAD